jgi:Lhr-like helicase
LSQGELIRLLGNFKDILNRLEQQKAAIDKAIAALREFDDGEIAETERPKAKHAAKAVKKIGQKRVMSEEGRKRIAEASKKRWAAVRKAAAKKAA